MRGALAADETRTRVNNHVSSGVWVIVENKINRKKFSKEEKKKTIFFAGTVLFK